MRYFLAFLLIFALPLFAGLPPTTTKAIGDSVPKTTFNFEFPNFSVSRVGTTTTFGTLGIAGGGTNNSTFNSTGIPYFDGTSLLTDGTNFTYNSTSKSITLGTTPNQIQIGTTDPFGRQQIWNYKPNASLRLGALASDGDPTTSSSEGIVSYGQNAQGDPMTSTDFGYARIKPMRFGLYNSKTAVADYIFRVDNTSMFFKDDSFVKTFEVTRATGNVNLPILTASMPVQTDASKNLISAAINLGTQVTGTLGISNGGTALSSTPSNGQLLIGNGTNYSLGTLTPGSGISITNGAGSVTIAATGGGTVTNVSTDSTMTGGPITTSGTLGVNVGTGANQIVQMTAGSQLPAIDGSLLTGFIEAQIPNLSATKITSGTLAIAQGGTNSVAALNNNRLMYSNTGSIIEMGSMTNGQIVVGVTSSAPSIVSMSGDATLSSLGTLTLATVPIAKGGTGLTGTPSNGQLLVGNATGYTLGTLGQGTGMAITNSAGTISLAVDVGTTANKIVQLNGSAQLPAVSGALLTNLPAQTQIYAAPTVQKFTSGSGTYNKDYTFIITSGNATVGATYTNNSVTFTVYGTVASSIKVVMSGSGAPLASGTLTKASGTGDSTLTFSQVLSPLYLKVEMVGGGGGGAGGGTAAVAGTAGNNSTFDNLTANGGGAADSGANGGAGGSGTIGSGWAGSIHPGNGGSGGNNVLLATYTIGGVGGGSALFGGGGYGGSTSVGGAGLTNSGGGGSGAGTASGSNIGGGGGGGGGGIIAVTDGVPSATYSYAIGGTASGGAGSGGTGAAGAAGYIKVTEFYQ